MEDGKLVDLGNYPEIHADGLGKVYFMAGNAQLYLFSWRCIDGLWRRIISGLVIRPISSLAPEQFESLRRDYAEGEGATLHH